MDIALNFALTRASKLLAKDLKKSGTKLVLAESCTGGLAASALVAIPGISDFFCGSFVVYRNDSKSRWLGIKPGLISKHGVVSPVIAMAMARSALKLTPEAKVAAAITGFLTNEAPGQDGRVCIAVISKSGKKLSQEFQLLPSRRSAPKIPEKAAAKKSPKADPILLRRQRQMLASQQLLTLVRALLN